MPSRRHCIAWPCLLAAGAVLEGCAGPLSGVPKHPWGRPVDFRGVRFDFAAVRIVPTIEGLPVEMTAPTGRFMAVVVTLTNTTGEPIPFHAQPRFHLLDADRAMFAPRVVRFAEHGRQRLGPALQPPSLQPGSPVTQELFFDAPAGDCMLLVTVPSDRALYLNGNVSPLTGHFILDIASELARARRVAHIDRPALPRAAVPPATPSGA